MSEHSLSFSSIAITKNRDTKPVHPPILTLDTKSKRIYVSNGNYKLKVKEVSFIDRSEHELYNDRSRTREKSLVLEIKSDKLAIRGVIASPSSRTNYQFDYFVDQLENTQGKLTKTTKGKESISVGVKKKVNHVTPARNLYMSPRRDRNRMASPLRQRQFGSVKQETRGNVVMAPKAPREIKLPPKSPRNTTPSKRFVAPKHVEVKKSVFSLQESEDELVDSPEEEPRRKRLLTSRKMEENDSDVEFDPPTAKKKLRLEEDELSSEDREIWMGINAGIEQEKGEMSDEKEESVRLQVKGQDKKETYAKHKLTEKIHPFFTTQPTKSKPVPKSDTFGSAMLFSPGKTTIASTSTPSPLVPQRAPMSKQMQRTGNTSRYFKGIKKQEDDEHEMEYKDDGTYYEPPLSEEEMKDVAPAPRVFRKSYGSKARNPYSNPKRNISTRTRKLGTSRIVPRDSSPTKQLLGMFSSTADRALSPRRELTSPRFKVATTEGSEELSKPIILGIQNLGNTCYLSVSLQILFGIPDFLRDLYKNYDAESSKKDMPLTQALLQVAVAIGVIPENEMPKIDSGMAKSKLMTNKAANPSALKKQMDVLTDKFVGYEQRDAHEFLSDLVDHLHEELVAKEKKEVVGKGEDASSDKENDDIGSVEANSHNSEKNGSAENLIKVANETLQVLPTDDYFHLKVRVCLECDSCKYSRSKDEMYRHLSLDVDADVENEPWNVERGLKQFFQPEKRDLKCEKCTSGQTATQTIEIISCPKALLLHFKRFIVTQEVRAPGKSTNDKDESRVMEMILKKNKARINLEDSLSVPIFVTEAKYNLRGVVHHVGNTAFSGHYTACGMRKTNINTQDNEEQWVCFDDRAGTKKDFEYVASNENNQRNCYMALYELKSS